MVTTGVMSPPKVSSPNARLPSSTLLMVSCQIHTLPLSLIQSSLIDFCLWAPPEKGRSVGEIEGEMVAWCTQPGHGTRVIPDGTITGVQFTKSPDYIQVVGFMNQSKINMLDDDPGGEMDPHGADAVRFLPKSARQVIFANFAHLLNLERKPYWWSSLFNRLHWSLRTGC
jgi:hypothetical protein